MIFSPGLGVPRAVSTLLVEELAARGYVVVALDHTHDALAVQFPGGRVEAGNLPQEEPTIRRALAVRVADVRFVLGRLDGWQRRGRLAGRLDRARIGIAGHSLGGATAASAMLVDRRLRAGILLDGTLHGAVVQGGLNRPFMIMNSAGGFEQDANRQAFWAHLRGPRFNFVLAGSGHFSFTDLAALTPQFAPTIPPGLAAFPIGEIGAARRPRRPRLRRRVLRPLPPRSPGAAARRTLPRVSRGGAPSLVSSRLPAPETERGAPRSRMVKQGSLTRAESG